MDDRQKLLPDGGAPPPPYAPEPMRYTQPVPAPASAPPPYDPTQPPPRPVTAQQTTIVVQQGVPVRCIPVHTVPPPPDYTALAIIATICFFPLGLIALFLALKVREHVANGDYRSAYAGAVSTRILSRLSISLGTLVLVCIILAIVLPITVG